MCSSDLNWSSPIIKLAIPVLLFYGGGGWIMKVFYIINLLVQHLKDLRALKPIDVPLYDFKSYTRTGEVERFEPQPVVLVEGILIFAIPELRDQFDIKLFVDTDADLRFHAPPETGYS